MSLFLLLLCASGCTDRVPRPVTSTYQAMGTEVKLTIWTADAPPARAISATVFREFDRVDALLSVWRHGSDVLRINGAPTGTPVHVSQETIEVLHAANTVSTWTGGKFDVTFGALSEVWRFDHDRDDRVPTDDEIGTRLPRIDYRAVSIDAERSTVALNVKDVRIHLGGIGKGYAVDRAIEALREAGYRDFMIQFGGDLYVSGRAGHDAWRLGVNDPRGASNDSFAVVELSDATLSTSGDYERFFIRHGVRYHHLLDPDTGRPATGCRSVTVVASSAMLADALSTGVFIMGPHSGMELIERLPDVDAVIVSTENEVLVSTGLRDRLHVLHPPTP